MLVAGVKLALRGADSGSDSARFSEKSERLHFGVELPLAVFGFAH